MRRHFIVSTAVTMSLVGLSVIEPISTSRASPVEKKDKSHELKKYQKNTEKEISLLASSEGEDVQVSARRRDQQILKAQSVPQAATVVTSEELKAEHITNIQQAARLIPSLQVNAANPRNTGINIRGLGGNGATPTDGIEGGVAAYVDGVYRARPGTVLADMPNLESITVTRGPTGTLGGMSTTAGSLDIETIRPNFTPQAYGEAGVGNIGYSRWVAGVNAPIFRDKLALRVDGMGQGNEGWVQNRYDNGNMMGQTSRAVRGSLLYKPTENLSVRVAGDYSHLRLACCQGGYSAVAYTRANGTSIPNNLAVQSARIGYSIISPSSKPYAINADAKSAAEQEDMGVAAYLDWKHEGATLSSISAYRVWNFNPWNDGDNSSLDITTNGASINQRQFTQEFRFSNHWRNIVDYNVGGFYLWQENNVHTHWSYGADAPLWYGYNNPLGNYALNGLRRVNEAQPTTNDYAAYASALWHIARKLELVTGIRYDYETKTGSFNQTVTGQSLAGLSNSDAATVEKIRDTIAKNNYYNGHLDNGFVTAQATLTYHINDTSFLYAQYGRGQKSGGLNLSSLPVGAPSSVKAEYDNSYEIGSKNSFLHNTLFVNGAFYWMKDKNYQVTTYMPLASGNLVSYMGNAKSARSRGFEGDVHYNWKDFLTVGSSVAYNDATYTSYNNAPCGPDYNNNTTCSLTGTYLPYSPRWVLSVFAQYRTPLSKIGLPNYQARISGSYNYKTNMNSISNKTDYGKIPGYGTLNLDFGIRPLSNRWEFTGFVHNVTNERRITMTNQGFVSGTFVSYVTEPLNFGFIAKTSY